MTRAYLSPRVSQPYQPYPLGTNGLPTFIVGLVFKLPGITFLYPLVGVLVHMARTIPWLQGHAQNTHHKANVRPVKRQKLQALDSDDDAPSTAALSPSRRNAMICPGKPNSSSNI